VVGFWYQGKVGGDAGAIIVMVRVMVMKVTTTKLVKRLNKRVRSKAMVQQQQQAERPEKREQSQPVQELVLGPVVCDQCSARAKMEVTLNSGILTFCHHHYNINAQALTEKGGIAKLLDISGEKVGLA
jgi:hypothetical protein